MTADEQSTMCSFLGKRSDDPENIDCIPTIFNHEQERTKSEIIKVDQRRKRHKSICEKRVIITDTSSNSNKNEECRGEKEVSESSKVILITMVAVLMVSSKLATLGVLKTNVLGNEYYDLIISVHDVTKTFIT